VWGPRAGEKAGAWKGENFPRRGKKKTCTPTPGRLAIWPFAAPDPTPQATAEGRGPGPAAARRCRRRIPFGFLPFFFFFFVAGVFCFTGRRGLPGRLLSFATGRFSGAVRRLFVAGQSGHKLRTRGPGPGGPGERGGRESARHFCVALGGGTVCGPAPLGPAIFLLGGRGRNQPPGGGGKIRFLGAGRGNPPIFFFRHGKRAPPLGAFLDGGNHVPIGARFCGWLGRGFWQPAPGQRWAGGRFVFPIKRVGAGSPFEKGPRLGRRPRRRYGPGPIFPFFGGPGGMPAQNLGPTAGWFNVQGGAGRGVPIFPGRKAARGEKNLAPRPLFFLLLGQGGPPGPRCFEGPPPFGPPLGGGGNVKGAPSSAASAAAKRRSPEGPHRGLTNGTSGGNFSGGLPPKATPSKSRGRPATRKRGFQGAFFRPWLRGPGCT